MSGDDRIPPRAGKGIPGSLEARTRETLRWERALALGVVLVASASFATAQQRTVEFLAGHRGYSTLLCDEAIDGPAGAGRIAGVYGVALASDGDLLLADGNNSIIRRLSPAGDLTTFAGRTDQPGGEDGAGDAARFGAPLSIAKGPSGDFFVADLNGVVRKVTPAGEVSTLAGVYGNHGDSDGIGTNARFRGPSGVAVDAGGSVWLTDSEAHTIRRIFPSGVVVTVAGSPGIAGSDDGVGAAARFFQPMGIAVDGDGRVLVCDVANHSIRAISPDGVVTTLAGSAGVFGWADGLGSEARFWWPTGIAFDGDGVAWVADRGTSTIRRVSPEGLVQTWAGVPGAGSVRDGAANEAWFASPAGIVVDALGTIFVSDVGYHGVRRISAGVPFVSTILGSDEPTGATDGSFAEARFRDPATVAIDSDANLFVADGGNSTVRKLLPNGKVTTWAGMARVPGSSDGFRTAARFGRPLGVASAGDGSLWVTDNSNHTVRRISPTGWVTTVAGLAGTSGSANGAGSAARFFGPLGVDVDPSGNAIIADYGNSTIRKVTPAGAVTTIAGAAGQVGTVDGTGGAARFFRPWGVAVDADGNIFVSDEEVATIRKIAPGNVVTTFAGAPGGFGLVDGPGSVARFARPRGLAVDPLGNLFVADGFRWNTGHRNNVIRRITPAGIVDTVAGEIGGECSGVFADGGAETALWGPDGVAWSPSGDLIIADTVNQTIKRARPSIPDEATIDSPLGCVGIARTLDAQPRTGTAWRWEIVRRPWGSTSELSDPTSPTPTFVPDRVETWVFRLTASGASGSSISRITLRATDQSPPVITRQPEPLTICEGTMAVFSVETVGGSSFQWKRNGVLIEGETGASLVILPATAAMSGESYSCEVTNPCGFSSSVAVPLVVNDSARPRSLGNSFRLQRWNGLTEFSWEPVSGADGFAVRMDSSPAGPFSQLAAWASAPSSGIGTGLPPGEVAFFVVRGTSPCGEGP